MKTNPIPTMTIGPFVVKPVVFPNPSIHGFEVFHEKERLGGGRVHPEGFLVNGKRKPMPTIRSAIRQMIKRRAEKAHKEMRLMQRIMMDLHKW